MCCSSDQFCPWFKLYLPCDMKFLRVLIFVIFPAICKNKFPQIKITASIFSTKIYSGENILYLKFTTQKYSTKKSCLFYYNMSLLFRNKVVYNEILVLNTAVGYTHRNIVWKM